MKMAKLNELFPKEKRQIETYDVDNIKGSLIISKTELTGETKKSLWLSFENYTLKYRLNRKTMIALCKQFEIDDTDDLECTEINFIVVNGEAAIEEITKAE